MTNTQAIALFIAGKNVKGKNSNGTISFCDNVLSSYWTPIARIDGDKLFLNVTKYSKTTSKLQNKLRAAWPKNHIVEVDAI